MPPHSPKPLGGDAVDARLTLKRQSWLMRSFSIVILKRRRAKLSSAAFKECKLTGANFEEVAHLGLSFEDTLLIGADLRKMSFRKNQLCLKRVDAKLFRGATISLNQAAELLGELGITVA